MSPDRLVIDVGNTRLKWGRLDHRGRIIDSFATAVDDYGAWQTSINRLVSEQSPSPAAIASVNPPIADRLGAWLERSGIGPIQWFRSAADVSLNHRLEAPEQTGADRALAVLAALDHAGQVGPGIVVQCGTAITVERIDPEGCWLGGAIAIGPGLASRALQSGTAQLPSALPLDPERPTPAWGASTLPALEAGLLWGAVGTIRELIARQGEGLNPEPWVIWTGGDAPILGPRVSGAGVQIEPDLVLMGAALAGFRGPDHPIDATPFSR
ncbi:type III pantothenate kinase [Tautonia rosea]|uniref:type III pantothenate kinase n=1 Tax=Tautonia rosea TaxID=2728037 RepID=UPI001474875A|nr:type III pantothenate kinase [Tautonia rosea]